MAGNIMEMSRGEIQRALDATPPDTSSAAVLRRAMDAKNAITDAQIDFMSAVDAHIKSAKVLEAAHDRLMCALRVSI